MIPHEWIYVAAALIIFDSIQMNYRVKKLEKLLTPKKKAGEIAAGRRKR